jgi:predicted nucleic acid-binding protein
MRRAGTPVADHDLWIAATAMQYGLRLLTLDTDFLKISQIVVDLVGAA